MENSDLAVLTHPQLIDRGLDQILIVTDHQNGTFKQRESFDQRIDSIHIEMIARFVQQQDIRFAPRDLRKALKVQRSEMCDLGKSDSAFLTTGEGVHRLEGKAATDTERAKMAAEFLLLDRGKLPCQILQRRQGEIQSIHVMLTEDRKPSLQIDISTADERWCVDGICALGLRST